jgi:hypothetical protein
MYCEIHDDDELTSYLHTKLMEEMIRWVYEHPPPDMASILKAKADKMAKAADQPRKVLPKAEEHEHRAGPSGSVAEAELACSGGRAAKRKATAAIRNDLAQEGALPPQAWMDNTFLSCWILSSLRVLPESWIHYKSTALLSAVAMRRWERSQHAVSCVTMIGVLGGVHPTAADDDEPHCVYVQMLCTLWCWARRPR